MATSAFTKFFDFTNQLAKGTHNFGSHSFKVALTNTLPTTANALLADITQIAAGNGYTTGGLALSVTLSTSGGVAKITIADKSVAASGGSMATWRYAVIFNDTATSKNLFGWVDYGTAITLGDGEAVLLDFDDANGALTIT